MKDRRLESLHDVAAWPRSIRIAVDGIATVFAFAMQLALERRRNLGGDAGLLAEIAALQEENRAQRIQLELLRTRLKTLAPKHRPHFKPENRMTILRLMWSNLWTIKETAQRLVLNPSTIRRWLRVYHGEDNDTKVQTFFGKPPWNKLADAVYDLIRDCRVLFPEPETGARTFAAQIIRAGVAVSRSTIRRVLKSAPKKASVAAAEKPSADDAAEASPTTPPRHILKPTKINRTWHADFTTFRVFGLKVHVFAILDGFSRKLLTLKVSLSTPTARDVLASFRAAIEAFGGPRFVVSDHGSQFRDQFDEGLDALSKEFGGPDKPIIHAQSKVKNPRFNGRCERFFRTLKLWQRLTLFFVSILDIQSKVDLFRCWFNTHRVHQGVGGRTPDDVWNNTPPSVPVRYLARDHMQPVFNVAREHHGGDPNLPVFDIKLKRLVKRVA